jgi:hypothetical protein
MVFVQHNCTVCGGLVKGAATVAPAEMGVINTI